MDIKKLEELVTSFSQIYADVYAPFEGVNQHFTEFMTRKIMEGFVKPAMNHAYEVSARIALDNLADDKWATCSGIAKLIREEKIK